MISGIQISSFRPMMTNEEEMADTFRRVREMGCDTVQLQWIGEQIPPENIAKALKEEGIRSVSTQDFYEKVMERKEYFIRLNQLTGGEWVCVSGIPGEYLNAEGLPEFVERLKEFQRELNGFGLKLCFHPRAVEFQKIEGTEPVEFLVRQMPEDFMLCLDLYHVNHAGLSMAETIRRFAGKICMVHFKDYRKTKKGEMLAPAGQGDTDWAAAMKECLRAEIPYGFVEQEQWDRDAFACLKEAFDWLNKEKNREKDGERKDDDC